MVDENSYAYKLAFGRGRMDARAGIERDLTRGNRSEDYLAGYAAGKAAST